MLARSLTGCFMLVQRALQALMFVCTLHAPGTGVGRVGVAVGVGRSVKNEERKRIWLERKKKDSF